MNNITSITFRLDIGKDHMTSSGFFRHRVVQYNKQLGCHGIMEMAIEKQPESNNDHI